MKFVEVHQKYDFGIVLPHFDGFYQHMFLLLCENQNCCGCVYRSTNHKLMQNLENRAAHDG